MDFPVEDMNKYIFNIFLIKMHLQSASDWQTHVGFMQALMLSCAAVVSGHVGGKSAAP